MNRNPPFVFLIACHLFLFISNLFAQVYFGLPVEIYAKRRTGFLQQMPDNSIAVFQSATAKTRSRDINYEYRQNSDLLYLTGISQPNTALILVKNVSSPGVSENTSEILFLPKITRRNVEGTSINEEIAKNVLGFKKVFDRAAFNKKFNTFLKNKKVLFAKFEPDFIYEPLSQKRYFIGREAKKLLREKYPGLRVESPGKIMTRLREIKSQEELKLMQKAIDITCDAHIQAMRNARPGMYEYELEAIIEYVFKRSGAQYPAFPSIIGSGPNSTIIHYWRNERKMQSGDVVVIDIGAEYFGYAADVTRTLPVNGKFTPAQRELYEIVLRAQKEAIAAVRPGIPFRKIHKIARQVIESAGFGKYFIHSTSHYLGMDVHDVGDYRKLKPGMVITVEPGIYIPEGSPADKKYWNIGIRIEDDVLVTKTGHKVLSLRAPKEIKAIESLMEKSAGMSSKEFLQKE